jgi:hypothetical protein
VPPLIHFIPVSRTYSVPLFLKRRGGRTLVGHPRDDPDGVRLCHTQHDGHAGRVRSHRRLRKRRTDSISESGVKWLNIRTKRRWDRTFRAGPDRH